MITKVLGLCAVLLVLTFILLPGCKIEVTAPEGGRVVTQSGAFTCESGETCFIDVVDVFFDETFEAEPASGYVFVNWRKRDRGLCGGGKDPCHIYTATFPGTPLEQFLEWDEVFYLEPVFYIEKWDSDGDGIFNEEHKYPFGVLSAGWRHSCAISTKGIKCWGYNEHGQSRVPEKLRNQSHNPRQVSAGSYHTCAVHDGGVTCWGEFKKVPAGLTNPVQVAAGIFDTCVIDDSGVKCWDQYGVLDHNVPDLADPIQVVVGGSHACALDTKGVHCWGELGKSDVPENLINPRQITTSNTSSCVLDDVGVQCWPSSWIEKVWKLDAPRQISGGGSSGSTQVCAIDANRPVCRGFNQYISWKEPSKAREIRVGVYHTCIVVDSSVTCGATNEYGQSDVPPGLVVPH